MRLAQHGDVCRVNYTSLGRGSVRREVRMAEHEVNRREFFKQVGVTVGAAALGGLTASALIPQRAEAQAPAQGKIPDTPYKIGHMTFLSVAAAILGAPMLKGHILAAEAINADGGFLRKRKIETITADPAAGTDANRE